MNIPTAAASRPLHFNACIDTMDLYSSFIMVGWFGIRGGRDWPWSHGLAPCRLLCTGVAIYKTRYGTYLRLYQGPQESRHEQQVESRTCIQGYIHSSIEWMYMIARVVSENGYQSVRAESNIPGNDVKILRGVSCAHGIWLYHCEYTWTRVWVEAAVHDFLQIISELDYLSVQCATRYAGNDWFGTPQPFMRFGYFSAPRYEQNGFLLWFRAK